MNYAPYLGAIRGEHVRAAARSIGAALIEVPVLEADRCSREGNSEMGWGVRIFDSGRMKQGRNNHQTAILPPDDPRRHAHADMHADTHAGGSVDGIGSMTPPPHSTSSMTGAVASTASTAATAARTRPPPQVRPHACRHDDHAAAPHRHAASARTGAVAPCHAVARGAPLAIEIPYITHINTVAHARFIFLMA